MAKLFILSSAGDTELAKETIQRLLASDYHDPIYVLPLTETARKATASLPAVIKVENINKIIDVAALSTPLEDIHLERLNRFITSVGIDHVYVGVPSPSHEEVPFQIAESLHVPFILVYEFMFKALDHCLWRYIERLARKDNATFAAPLPLAADDIKAIAPHANVRLTSHLSIDKAMKTVSMDATITREQLGIGAENHYIFASGTSQPHAVDNDFVEALLAELATGKYPHLQLRFGIHPGVAELETYLDRLAATCSRYPEVLAQFKIIFPDGIKSKLTTPTKFNENPWFLHENISGPAAANAANAITQAVPGALLNEAAIAGKPVYFHKKTPTYLPPRLFSENIATFFKAPSRTKCIVTELGLPADMPEAPAVLKDLLLS